MPNPVVDGKTHVVEAQVAGFGPRDAGVFAFHNENRLVRSIREVSQFRRTHPGPGSIRPDYGEITSQAILLRCVRRTRITVDVTFDQLSIAGSVPWFVEPVFPVEGRLVEIGKDHCAPGMNWSSLFVRKIRRRKAAPSF